MEHSAIPFNQSVWLMIWETNPLKMKKNNIIKFNSTVDVNVGDSLLVGIKEGVRRVYRIDDIIEKRDSSMAGMKYYTAKRSIQLNGV